MPMPICGNCVSRLSVEGGTTMNLADIPYASNQEITKNFPEIVKDPTKAKALLRRINASSKQMMETIALMQKPLEIIEKLKQERVELQGQVAELEAEAQRQTERVER